MVSTRLFSGIGLACSMTSTNALVIAEYENHQITKAKSIETIAYTLGKLTNRLSSPSNSDKIFVTYLKFHF